MYTALDMILLRSLPPPRCRVVEKSLDAEDFMPNLFDLFPAVDAIVWIEKNINPVAKDTAPDAI